MIIKTMEKTSQTIMSGLQALKLMEIQGEDVAYLATVVKATYLHLKACN
jgi:nitrate reductase NapAB chaperone NapD